jgi:hypothetical protein
MSPDHEPLYHSSRALNLMEQEEREKARRLAAEETERKFEEEYVLLRLRRRAALQVGSHRQCTPSASSRIVPGVKTNSLSRSMCVCADVPWSVVGGLVRRTNVWSKPQSFATCAWGCRG